jgi:ATP-dependent Lhr-like helicase
VADVLDLFSPPVADWFRETFGRPTPPQAQGWPAIARGENALILSPTGSGKTLTAFLWSLDALFRELQVTPEPEGRPTKHDPYVPGVRVVYVSPLKALNNDVERNLQVPLHGIRRASRRHGEPLPAVRVAVRTGDTPAADRERMLRRPPQILITTPESLYLMLTAERARALFATTHTVIVDEIHTLVGSKRGAHLALSLERLERLAAPSPSAPLDGEPGPRPPPAVRRGVQRVGLSATVRPLEDAAHFLVGADRPVTIVDAAYRKPLDLRVITPVENFRELRGESAWTQVIPRVVELIDQHRTTLVFCNSRRLAERTADRINERRLLERGLLPDKREHYPWERGSDVGIFASGVDASYLRAAGLEPIRAHHGSMSKSARLEMEAQLKSGALPALVATSSLELGIDVGSVDLVVHLQSPKSVAAGLQRVGRAGHLVGQTSVGRIFTTHPEDVMEAAAVAHGMLRGEIESTHTPENPLDVLAQHVVAMVGVEEWDYDELLALVRRAWPFRNLGDGAFRAVIDMLAGKYPERVSRQLQPRISWDRVNNRLAALPGTRGLAIQSGGTIPDRGAYALVLPDKHTKVGELDEEFVFETRKGDTFLLGSQVWRAIDITEDRVIAEPAPGEVPRMPFWRGDYPWRPYDLGKRIGAFRRRVAEGLTGVSDEEIDALKADFEHPPDRVAPLVAFLRDECALDRSSILQIVDYVHGEREIATDRTLIVELFEDAVGDPRLVLHSPFGGRVNGPWAIVLAAAMRERLGVEAQINTADDGILLRFNNADVEPPVDLIRGMTSAEARERILADLPNSAVFTAQFRMNAARALLLPRQRGGKRTPLWLSRLKAKDLLQAVLGFDDFPIVLETYRDCLRDVMDLDGLTDVLDRISRGEIRLVVEEAELPSPLARSLDQRFAMQYVYEYDQPRGERQIAQLSLNRALLAELLQDGRLAELLKPEAVADVAARAARTAPEARARSAEELAQVLFELGDLSSTEVAARAVADDWSEWIRQLAGEERIVPLRIAGQERWVHAEHAADYARLADDPAPVLHRRLVHSGPTTASDLAARYGLPEPRVLAALESLGPDVLSGTFAPGGPRQWVDRGTLEQMHRRTLTLLRREVQPVPLNVYAELLARWHRVLPLLPGTGERAGRHALGSALQQLRGFLVPAVAWERDVLPLRVPGLDTAELAERCQAGELMWVAEGGKDPRRARLAFYFRGDGGVFLDREPAAEVIAGLSHDARLVHDFLRDEGAALLPDLRDGTGLAREPLQSALVELALAGLVTNDTIDALHALLGYEPPRPPERRGIQSTLAEQLAERWGGREPPRPLTRYRMMEARKRARIAVQQATRTAESRGWVGRWSLVHRTALLGRPIAEEDRLLRQARQLLARWGVVTRAALEREAPTLRWDALYPILGQLEMRGEVRRGYFVEGLPGAQFAVPDAVDQLRAVAAELRDTPEAEAPVRVLSAADPAQLFGTEEWGGPLRFARVASTAVAAVRGEPVAVMDEGGTTVDAADGHPRLIDALRALAAWWRARSPHAVKVERWNGQPVTRSPGAPLLEAAGFARDYTTMVWLAR